MARYSFYVDGFNVYYALKDRTPDCKWLNYYALASAAIGSKDSIAEVVFFTSLATWKAEQTRRQKEYIKALRSVGVEVVHGRFGRKEIRCHKCQKVFITHSEKRTDVNIALRVLSDAVLDVYDRAVILSADSDLLPVISTVHRHAATKEIGIMFPIGRTSFALRQEADFTRKMKPALLKACQFPDEIDLGDGVFLRKPAEWA